MIDREPDDFLTRHKRVITIVFFVVAVLATALAWAGESFRSLLRFVPSL